MAGIRRQISQIKPVEEKILEGCLNRGVLIALASWGYCTLKIVGRQKQFKG